MIYLDIVGRCGNQMFQYAFAKKISITHDNEKICIDFHHVYKEAKQRNDKTFKNELDSFHASDSFSVIDDGANKIYQYGSRKQILVFKIYTKIKRVLEKLHFEKRFANRMLYKIMSHYGIYWYFAPRTLKPCKEKNKFIWGYFEDPAYFDDIRETLCEDFTPLYGELEHNYDLYKTIKESNSVCVSFRKWNDNEPVTDERFVCTRKYYQNAIKKIFELIPNARLIAFSNDVEWVKQQFDLPENTIYENGNDEVYEKIRLMSSCKHFVLSNSTFSWWAQYLGRFDNKFVISPEYWFANESKPNPLLQSNFKRVSNFRDGI